MLTGILVPTSGHVRVCGLEPTRERARLAHRIGAVFGQRSQLWWDLPLQRVLPAARLHPPVAGRRVAASIRGVRRAPRHGPVPGDAGAPALPRPADAGRGDGRPAALPRPARARRADHRARPAQQGGAARLPDPGTPGARHHHPADHPRPARHRAALRPAAGRRPRPPGLRRLPAHAGQPSRCRAGARGRPRRARPAARRRAGHGAAVGRGRRAAPAPGVPAGPNDRRRGGRRGQRARGAARPDRDRARHRGRRPPDLPVHDPDALTSSTGWYLSSRRPPSWSPARRWPGSR